MRKPSPRLSRFLAGFAISFCVVRVAKYLLPEDIDSGRRTGEYEKAKQPSRGINHSTQSYEGHWQKRHPQLSKDGSVARPGPVKESPAPSTIYLMLPLWIRTVRAPMYEESDAEWQAAAKLQADKKRVDELRKEVTRLVAKQLSQPQHIVNLKHIQYIKQVAVNLEVVPPVYPPNVYEVPCIYIEPGHDPVQVSYGWRAVPDKVGSKLERIFHPVIFAQAFAAGVKEFSLATYLITKARLVDMTRDPRIISVMWDITKSSSRPPTAQEPPLSAEERTKMRFPTSRASEKDMKVILPFLRGEFGDETSRQKYRDLVKSMTYQAAIEHGCSVFHHTWMTKQNTALQTSQRGACHITGYIDCLGERGKYRIEVVATYLPEANALLGRPVITRAFVIPDLPKWNAPKGQKTDLRSIAAPEPPMTNPTKQAARPPHSRVTQSSSEGKGEEK